MKHYHTAQVSKPHAAQPSAGERLASPLAESRGLSARSPQRRHREKPAELQPLRVAVVECWDFSAGGGR